MADVAEAALLRAYGNRLEAGAAVWDTHIYSGSAPARAPKPYVVFSFGAGGRAYKARTKDALITIDAVCVANDLATALAGADMLSQLLEETGSQDFGSNKGLLSGGEWWEITTVTEQEHIAMDERINDGAEVIYHRGAQFENNMERIA